MHIDCVTLTQVEVSAGSCEDGVGPEVVVGVDWEVELRTGDTPSSVGSDMVAFIIRSNVSEDISDDISSRHTSPL